LDVISGQLREAERGSLRDGEWLPMSDRMQAARTIEQLRCGCVNSSLYTYNIIAGPYLYMRIYFFLDATQRCKSNLFLFFIDLKAPSR